MLYLYLYLVIPWQYIDRNQAQYNLNYDRLALACILVLLGVLALLCWRSGGAWRRLYGLLFVARFAIGISSQLSNHAIDLQLYYPGSWYDIPYAAALASFTFVGLLGLRLSATKDEFGKRSTPPLRITRVAILAVLSLPIIAGVTLLDHRAVVQVIKFRELVTLSTILVMTFLVFLQEDRLKALLAKTNETLEHVSLTDPLTGVRNRRFYHTMVVNGEVNHVLRSVMNPKSRRSPRLVFYIVDLDNFKAINDEHGHEGGDLVLVEMARRIGSTMRRPDVVIRWGGDEFLVVCRQLDTRAGELLASRILSAVASAPFSMGKDGLTERLTCSIGWAVFPWLLNEPKNISADAVLGLADQCVYAAKQAGKNRAIGVVPAIPGSTASNWITDSSGVTYKVQQFCAKGPSKTSSGKVEEDWTSQATEVGMARKLRAEAGVEICQPSLPSG